MSKTRDKWETEKNLAAFEVYEFDFYSISSWTPLPDGKGKPEQVHLCLRFKDEADLMMVLRLKSKRAVDEMIDALISHRDDVWPPEAS